MADPEFNVRTASMFVHFSPVMFMTTLWMQSRHDIEMDQSWGFARGEWWSQRGTQQLRVHDMEH